MLWALLLKPTVKSTARDAAQEALVEPLQQATAQIAALNEKVGLPPAAPLVPGGGSGAGDPATTTTTAAAGPITAPGEPTANRGQSDLGTPFDGRLEATPESQTVSYTVPDGEVFSLTDIFLQNPQGDSGLLLIQRGATTLLSVRLENFRDLDYHFISPLVFSPGQMLTLSVECANPAPAAPDSCTPAATYNGFTRSAPPPTTPPA